MTTNCGRVHPLPLRHQYRTPVLDPDTLVIVTPRSVFRPCRFVPCPFPFSNRDLESTRSSYLRPEYGRVETMVKLLDECEGPWTYRRLEVP